MFNRWVYAGILILILVGATGCDCGGPTVGSPCGTTDDCSSGEVCLDSFCRAVPDGGLPDGSFCPDGRGLCSALCCGAGQVCNTGVCGTDCGADPICAGECCGTGQECVANACVVECADVSRRCGAADDQCCTADQACLRDTCVDLGVPCTMTDDCPSDFLCEVTLMRCVPRDAVDVCEFRPPVGVFDPVVACQWVPPAGTSGTWDDVVMTPSVMNMTDDNGDGVTDTLDIPDIVFIAFDRQADGCCTARGRLVVISGACNTDGTMNTHAIIETPFVGNSSGVALGNLDPDSSPAEAAPEIVATFQSGGTIAWRRAADDGSAWTELWRNDTALTNAQTRGGAQPALADLNADGAPEVIVGNVVLNGLTGAVIWDGAVTVGPTAGVGNNAFLGPASTVADLDLDGLPEVIAGNTVYNGMTGAEIWTYTFTTTGSACGGSIPCDGFNGVGNFDADPEGEVVIVRLGEVFVINHDGTLLHQVSIPVDDCSRNESGPPTIADFDGDGRPEIGTAGADFYVVVDFDCTGTPLPAECASTNILWTVPNEDCSSRATGSSVFDFEGDGSAEVVYADETSFRIFSGRDGTVLYEDTTHSSNTRMEMPIVVDVDNDGKSEVVIPEPNQGAVTLGGIEIWEDSDNNWVRTRRVWNQHTYHVSNITEDGQVPRSEPVNWSDPRLNNFRQNVQPNGAFDAPDLVIDAIAVAECIAGGTLRIAVTVSNRGALGVPAGINVFARATAAGGTPADDLPVQMTTIPLLPGQSEILIFEWTPAGGFTFMMFTVEAIADDDGTGVGQYNECDEMNNMFTSETLMTCMFG